MDDERLKIEREVPKDPAEPHVGHPRGTLLIMLIFLMLIIALWGYVYLLMLERV
jgi:hypothetical protein